MGARRVKTVQPDPIRLEDTSLDGVLKAISFARELGPKKYRPTLSPKNRSDLQGAPCLNKPLGELAEQITKVLAATWLSQGPSLGTSRDSQTNAGDTGEITAEITAALSGETGWQISLENAETILNSGGQTT